MSIEEKQSADEELRQKIEHRAYETDVGNT